MNGTYTYYLYKIIQIIVTGRRVYISQKITGTLYTSSLIVVNYLNSILLFILFLLKQI